jgi:hypothetical protein
VSSNTQSLAHHAPLFAAKQKMEQIKTSIRAFNHWWPDYVISSKVWPLPVAEKSGHGNVSWLPALDQIDFETIEHPAAVDAIKDALINFHRFPNDPALNIRRWPGYVVLRAAVADEMRQRLSEINLQKDELQQILSVIPDGTRPIALRKTFPGEHILAAYRHIHCAQQSCDALTFTWQGKLPKNKPIERDKLIQMLRDEIKDCFVDSDLSGAAQREKEIGILNELSSSIKLVERKLFAPSPRYVAFYDRPLKAGGKGDEMGHAPLPYFMAQDTIPNLIDLPMWSNTGNSTSNGRKSLDYAVILPRIRIYATAE